MAQTFETRSEHFEAFSEQQRQRFEDEMLGFLRQHHADRLAGRDDEWVRELIRLGVDNAGEYGIVLERDVARYLELMVVLSPDLDQNPEMPWAGRILRDESLGAEQKLDELYGHIIFDPADAWTGTDLATPGDEEGEVDIDDEELPAAELLEEDLETIDEDMLAPFEPEADDLPSEAPAHRAPDFGEGQRLDEPG